jgi:hypothetical protein
MLRGLLVLASLLSIAAPARADAWAKATYAHFSHAAPDAVGDVVRYTLPRGMDYSDVLIGRHTDERVGPLVGAVLLRCNAGACRGTRLWLEPGSEVKVLGVVDLAGAPGPLSGREVVWPTTWGDNRIEAPASRRRPALVLRTTRTEEATGTTRFGRTVTGSRTRTDLMLVSLRRADERSPRIFKEPELARFPTGGGTSASYRLERGEGRALEIVATARVLPERDSTCLPPKPTEHRYVRKDGRYVRRDSLTATSGCPRARRP